MNKKGQGLMMGGSGGLKMVSIVFALILIVVGIIPLLNQFGVIAFMLPTIPKMILDIILVIAGFLLLIDAFRSF